MARHSEQPSRRTGLLPADASQGRVWRALYALCLNGWLACSVKWAVGKDVEVKSFRAPQNTALLLINTFALHIPRLPAPYLLCHRQHRASCNQPPWANEWQPPTNLCMSSWQCTALCYPAKCPVKLSRMTADRMQATTSHKLGYAGTNVLIDYLGTTGTHETMGETTSIHEGRHLVLIRGKVLLPLLKGSKEEKSDYKLSAESEPLASTCALKSDTATSGKVFIKSQSDPRTDIIREKRGKKLLYHPHKRVVQA